VIRWFIIFLETLALIFIILENEKFNQLLERLLNAIPSSTELKLWLLKGINFGIYSVVVLSGIAITTVILYYIIPYIRELLNKEALIKKWEMDFNKRKQDEENKIESMKKEIEEKLQEVQKIKDKLEEQITHYQHLSHKLKQKEAELETKFQQKKGKYIEELSGLQRKNKELQIRIKRLKEQLKSCREKLKKRGLN
jgi:uncharacterized phage infection (PIP) family protein YhgE